jgi:hypothetical protein
VYVQHIHNSVGIIIRDKLSRLLSNGFDNAADDGNQREWGETISGIR